MSKTELKDYITVYKNAIKKEYCDYTVSKLKNQEFDQHSFYDSSEDKTKSISGDQELSVSYTYRSDYLQTLIWSVLHSYCKDHPGLGWDGYSFIRWNKYEQNKKMAPHWDAIKTLFDGKEKGIPILTVLGSLNDDYEGGEFVMWDDFEIKLNAGDIMVFPSTFLYPHRVEPVTSGNRYSWVSWAW